jgi:polysaccharide deacetylase family protein (PEP-CTERM system associated)
MRTDSNEGAAGGPLNVLSVDVEDYHNQLALEYQHRLERPNEEAQWCTERLLEIFADYQAKGTFFILGEIAEAFPQLVRRIAGEGHHLGVHGYHHLRVTWQSPAQFRESIQRAKSLIEDLTGKEADAYRAPWFSLNETTLWALDVLADLGFRYDSSIFPIRARRYGIPSAPRLPYRHRLHGNRAIWEVPLTTVSFCNRRVGACGGGHLRLFPLRFTQFAMRQLAREDRAAIVYLHPYEVEPHPRIECLPLNSWFERVDFRFYNFQQRVGRGTVENKVRWLLKNHRFGTVEQLVASIEATRAQASDRAEPAIEQATPLSRRPKAAAV